MSRSPSEAVETSEEYEAAWHALFELLRGGKSLSGRERNVCFLNTGGSRFAWISTASGLDYIDDGRAVAATDWDLDGDVDLWFANRTGPRIRYADNRTGSGNGFLLLRLEGRKSNRDAIGARVEVTAAGGGPALIKTLRAGDAFISQSSKWLHFGLGGAGGIDRVVVRWPAGPAEEFGGLEVNGRYTLVEGSGRAAAWSRPRPAKTLIASEQKVPESTDRAGILLLAPVPAPTLSHARLDGTPATPAEREPKGPMLVNLWASWCSPCAAELSEFVKRREELEGAGLRILALSVDGLGKDPATGPEDVRRFLEKIGYPFDAGLAEPPLLDHMQAVFDTLVPNRRSLPVPTSFLINATGDIAAIYKGPVSVDQLLSDVSNLRATWDRRLALAVPFEGIWHSPPRPPFFEYLGPIGSRYLEAGYPDEAIAHYRKMLRHKPDDRSVNIVLADLLAGRGRSTEAADHYRAVIALDPADAEAHRGLGMVLASQGDQRGAIAEYREALRILPDDAATHSNLALALAHEGSEEEAIVHLDKALELDPGNILARINLGLALMRGGDMDGAVENLSRAVALQPDHAEAHYHLGLALARAGRGEGAVEQLSEAVRLKPDLSRAHYQLGIVLTALDSGKEAVEHYERALAIEPELLAAARNLAWLLATHGDPAVRDGEEAVRLARQVCEATRFEQPLELDVLAAAYAEAKRFGEAVETARKAIDLARAGGQSQLVDRLSQHLLLYESGRPLAASGAGR